MNKIFGRDTLLLEICNLFGSKFYRFIFLLCFIFSSFTILHACMVGCKIDVRYTVKSYHAKIH